MKCWYCPLHILRVFLIRVAIAYVPKCITVRKKNELSFWKEWNINTIDSNLMKLGNENQIKKTIWIAIMGLSSAKFTLLLLNGISTTQSQRWNVKSEIGSLSVKYFSPKRREEWEQKQEREKEGRREMPF